MRVLIITNVFPNALAPRSSSFNRQQFAALGRLCEVEVLATLPWFPAQALLGSFADTKVASGVPDDEIIDGLRVKHPRTLHLPRIGGAIATPLYAASLLPILRRYRGRIDVVLGSWAHPDGCAAVILARLLGVPAVVKLHGSDINVVSELAGPRRAMKLLLPRAAAIVAVSRPLADKARSLGVAEDRIHVIRNGVDHERFRVRSRREAREALGLPLEDKIALCVGNLKESKGVIDLCDAFDHVSAYAPDLQLYFVGEGKARGALEARGVRLPRMHLVGSQPLEAVATWMAACDVLVLPSWNEGTPNVLLEALTCGRRVLATRVGGVPDVVTSAALGTMVPARAPKKLAQALLAEYATEYDPDEVAALGRRESWDESAQALLTVLREAASGKSA